MSRRAVERLLWVLALALSLAGWSRWRQAVPEPAEVPAGLVAAPTPPSPVIRERLAAAGRTIAGGNPFRLDRAPAPMGFNQPADPNAMAMGAPPPYVPPPPPRPQLAVSGIVGPPWQALLEGVPGREGALPVRAGMQVGDLRIRSVTRDQVVVVGPDTTWRLPVRKPWQP